MNKDFLIKYLNTDSPSTYEVEGQKIWLAELEEYADEVITDNYGQGTQKIWLMFKII